MEKKQAQLAEDQKKFGERIVAEEARLKAQEEKFKTTKDQFDEDLKKFVDDKQEFEKHSDKVFKKQFETEKLKEN